MIPHLTPAGYEQTKTKLSQLERRLSALRKRTDLAPTHFSEVERSYKDMIRQYCREISLYEAAHSSQQNADET